MPGLGLDIHVLLLFGDMNVSKAWMAGTSPATTT
jgi:hypothetical protein